MGHVVKIWRSLNGSDSLLRLPICIPKTSCFFFGRCLWVFRIREGRVLFWLLTDVGVPDIEHKQSSSGACVWSSDRTSTNISEESMSLLGKFPSFWFSFKKTAFKCSCIFFFHILKLHLITNPLYTWKITFNLHGTKVVTFFFFLEWKNAWVINKVAAYSCPNDYLKERKKRSQCKANTVWWNQLLIEVWFCSPCSSCLEELSFSAERVEIFYSTHQVTPQTLFAFLKFFLHAIF